MKYTNDIALIIIVLIFIALAGIFMQEATADEGTCCELQYDKYEPLPSELRDSDLFFGNGRKYKQYFDYRTKKYFRLKENKLFISDGNFCQISRGYLICYQRMNPTFGK